MSVKTSTLGAIHLSGKDAKKFSDQVRYGRPKETANTALSKGVRLLNEYDSKGYAVVRCKV